MNETTTIARRRSTMVARIAFTIVLFMGLAAVASGIGAAAVADDEPVSDRTEPSALAMQPPGDAIAQANDTTSEEEETTTNETDTAVTSTNETDAAVTSTNETDAAVNESADDVPVGARLAGVIGAQESEHRSAVKSRAFEKSFDNADTNASKAAVVSDQTAKIEERLRELERERDRLEDQYDAGNLSNGAYSAQMTTLEARLRALSYRANRTAVRGASIPAAALERAGLQRDRLEQLENRTARTSVPGSQAVTGPGEGPPLGVPIGKSTTGPANASAGPPATTGPHSGGPSNSSGPRQGPGDTNNGSETGNAGNGTTESPNGDPPGIDRRQNTPAGNGNANGKASGGPPSGTGNGSWLGDVAALEFVLGFVR